MSSLRRSIVLFLGFCCLLTVPAWAYDPPAGGVLVPVIPSAHALPIGNSVTELNSPWADWFNPAASATQQRLLMEASYVALTDFDKESPQGFGSAVSLGFSIPRSYAVWGTGFHFVYTPDSMSGLPLGIFGAARVTIAKELYRTFFIGAGLDLTIGGREGMTSGGFGFSLGFIHAPGDLGFFKDFRWGMAVTGIGLGYKPQSPATGAWGSEASAFAPPFTMTLGARTYLVRTRDFWLGVGLDLSAPYFHDFAFNFFTSISWRDIIGLRSSWGSSVFELMNQGGKSFWPTIGLFANIPLDGSAKSKDGAAGSAKPAREGSEIRTAFSAAPLYNNIWAMGIGATFPIDRSDTTPPRINAKYPASSHGPSYISPNNDGVQDSLDIPLEIREENLLAGWTFTVLDEKGEVVRRIFNKDARPETSGVKGLWDRLLYRKKGVAVPSSLVWNGIADSGEQAPDGLYSVQIEAVDDSGNSSLAGPFPLVIDTMRPRAELSSAENPPIFSPDGDGSKDSLGIKMSGSVEDLWTGSFLDAGGTLRRTIEFKSAAPSDFSWDGKGDDGKVLPDGVYSFVLFSRDRAGNSLTKRLDNIIINTQQPPVSLIIDLPAFSPNDDGSRDVITLYPGVPMRNGIVGWSIAVLDKDKKEVWNLGGKDASSLKESFVFDGRDFSAKRLPEGQYQALLSVNYQNGYGPRAASPYFALDLTAPSGSVSAERSAFNPSGEGQQSFVRFTQSGKKDALWTGAILDANDKVLRSWTFSPRPDVTLDWDGSDASGRILPDGQYRYRLSAMDNAGNAFTAAPVRVSIDTVKKALRLGSDYRAFSPLPGSLRPTVKFSPEVQSNDRVRSWELGVNALDAVDQAGTQLRGWKGSGEVPASIVWDGLSAAKVRVPDGRYVARLSVLYQNGDTIDAASPVILVDTVPPSIKVSVDTTIFSPTDGSARRSVRISQSSLPGDDWQGKMLRPDGSVLRSWSWKGQAADFAWDGSDEAGNPVPDGNYRYLVSSIDAAGNTGSASVPAITVDKRQVQVFVTATETGISPNGDGYKDDVAFNLIVKLREGIDTWRFALVDKQGRERNVFSGRGNDVPSRIVWDGRDSSGTVAEGEMQGLFSVNYLKGDKAEARSASVFVGVSGPRAEVNLRPAFFSPDNDGADDELTIGLKVQSEVGIADWRFDVFEQAVVEGAKTGTKAATRVFMSWSGSGEPAQSILWDGRSNRNELVESATDYPFVFTVRDRLGNSSKVEGAITVDVMVIRDGNRLKIKVPSIVFRPNAADFDGLDVDIISRNTKVVQRIAQILNRFSDYRIGIVGHANSVSKMSGSSAALIAQEEQTELLPLSLGRANLVKKLLTENGVDARRLSAQGLGSSEPVVDFKDAENRWKNRRVEFILIKN